jgi:hypothetical protein
VTRLRSAGRLVSLDDSSTYSQIRPLPRRRWESNVRKALALGDPFAITSVVVSNSTASPGSLVLSEYANTDCLSSPQGDVLVINTPAQDTVSLPFPTPLLVAPGGSNWCLTFDQNSGDRFTLVGYYY